MAFLETLVLTLDYDYYNYTDKGNTIGNKYSFLESNLTYQQKDGRWEFGVKGTNLLNTTTFNRDGTNELYFSTQSYFVRPRYVLFPAKYDI